MTPGLKIVLDKTGYLIIHERSGLHLDWFAIYHKAREAVEELGTLGDWTKSRSSVSRFGIRKIRAICSKHQF